MGRKDRDAAELRQAIERAVKITRLDISDDLFDQIMKEVWALPAFYSYRDLRWKFKNMAKASGKQGATIYDLRCQLAELRGLMSGAERSMERFYQREEIPEDSRVALPDVVARLNEQIGRLEVTLRSTVKALKDRDEQIKRLESTVAGLEAKLALSRQSLYPQQNVSFQPRLPADVHRPVFDPTPRVTA